MSTLARSARLALREMTTAGAAHAFDLNNDPEMLRHTGDAPFATVKEACAFLAAYPAYRQGGFGRWGVVLHDGTWPGWCGLHRQPDGHVDLGYRRGARVMPPKPVWLVCDWGSGVRPACDHWPHGP